MRQLYILISSFLILSSQSSLSGHDSDKIQSLEDEITLLKMMLIQMGEKLEKLESSKVSPNQTHKGSTTKNYTSADGWRDVNNWKKIKRGMNQNTVIQILGQPTSIKNLSPFTTLYYKGNLPNGANVSSSVKLSEDRVFGIYEPVF